MTVTMTLQEGSTEGSKTGERAEIEALRAELDGYWLVMQSFGGMEPDQVLLHLSSYSARVGHIRSWVVRSESRVFAKFRTTEVDPFLEQLELQFKIFSRIQSIRQFDWDLSKGQT